jgi:hypothetical protein
MKDRKEYWKQYYLKNREVILEKSRAYNTSHKKKISEYQKSWSEENKEHLKKYKSKYDTDNKESIRQSKREYEKNRYANDPLFKLRKRISRQVNRAIKAAGLSKHNQSIVKFLPYTLSQLKEHLEKQFEPWMTWNNYGNYTLKWDDSESTTWTWNIDHIIPQSDLPYISMTDDNFQKCWALNNLRPLSAKQNCLDGTNGIRHYANALSR